MIIVFDYNETGRYVEDTIFSNVTDKFVKVSILDKDTIELKAFLYSSVKNTDLNECLIDARFYSVDIEFEVQLNEITSKMYCKYNVEEAISDSDIQNVYKVSEGFINTNS